MEGKKPIKNKDDRKKKKAVKAKDSKRKKDGSRKKKTVKAEAPIIVKLNSPKKSKVERKSEQLSTKPIMGQLNLTRRLMRVVRELLRMTCW